MKSEDIDILDLYRILHGEIPLRFYLELVLRSVFVFIVLTFGMKYLGKRVSSQITRSELAATATLAAATGLVILAPERGLLPPLIIVGIVMVIQRFVHHMSRHSSRFARATEGHLALLVCNGEMMLDAMENTRITRHELFGRLRGSGVTQLGEVSRFYLEADGDFTLLKEPKPVPGLSVFPEWDKDILAEQTRSTEQVCSHCGTKRKVDDRCARCGDDHWQPAVTQAQ